MKFPFFASFIVFCLWLTYEIKKSRKDQKKSEDSFWETEARANNTRRQSLDGLSYITIPFDRLPMEVLSEDPLIREYQETLFALSKEPIVNLTGISNTDLKLTYGAPNINLLTLYDQRYTTLARTLQSWAKALYDRGFADKAQSILEFAVETRTDISGTYKLLASIYRENGQTDKIRELIPVACDLNSPLSSHIVSMLEGMCG
jgi:tetratricopeptide (TPR) repeat protein